MIRLTAYISDVIAEGNRIDLEKFASALQIKNAIIDVESASQQYSHGSGQYSSFKKITGPDEIGIDAGLSELKKDTMDAILEKYIGLSREIAEIKATLSEIKAKAS